MELDVEVVRGPARRAQAHELRVGDAAGQSARARAVARVDQFRRHGRRRARGRRCPPLRSWTVRPSRSFASRHASWRSGDSGMPFSTSWTRRNACCRSGARSSSSRTRWTAYVSAAARLRLEARRDRRPDPGPSAARRRGRRSPAASASSMPRSVASSPGRVGVEAEEDALRQPRQLLQLALGERGAHRRDDRLEPGLAQRDHVGVPLDDDARDPASRSPARARWSP